MSTAGPLNAGTCATDAPGNLWHGTVAWTNPTNAQGASDGVFATATCTAQSLDALKASNFGFSLPSGAIISAVTYEVLMKCLNGTPGTWNIRPAWGGNSNRDTNLSITVTTTLSWLAGNGVTLPTASQINGSDFGMGVYTTGSPSDTFSVDAFRITVTYSLPVTLAPAGASISATPGTPTLAAPAVMGPAGLSLALTPGTPAVSAGFVAAPAGASLSLTPGTPTLLAPALMAPAGLSLSLTPGTPVLLAPAVMGPAGLSLALTPGTPTVTVPAIVLAPAGLSLSLTPGGPPVITIAFRATPASASLSLTGGTNTVTVPPILLSPAGALIHLIVGTFPAGAFYLEADPLLNGSWSLDLTSAAQSEPGVALGRGRDLIRGLAPPKAGSLTARLLNQSGAYSPGGAAGLARNVPIRLMYSNGPIRSFMYSGILEQPSQIRPAFISYTDISSYGTLSRLAGKKVSTALYQSITTDQALGYLLAAVGLSGSQYVLDTGKTTLLWWWLDDEDAMAAMTAILNTEGPGACIYEDGQGRIIFKNRHARITEARSVSAQATFDGTPGTSHSKIRQPFQYDDGLKDVVNSCSLTISVRSSGTPASVVWSFGASQISLGPSESRRYQAVASRRDPFYDAIVPVEGTDYTVVSGSVTPTLDRASGATVTVTLTAGASGALVNGLQLRATPTSATQTQVSNTVDTSASQSANGIQSYGLSVRPDIDVNVAQDFANAVCSWWQNGRPGVALTIIALATADDRSQAFHRDISDRITVIEPHTGISDDFWIEEIDQVIHAPVGHLIATIRGQEATRSTYFIVGSSQVGGADVLGF